MEQTPATPAPGDTTIRDQKKVLRKQVRSKVREMTDEQVVEQSHKVWSRLFQSPQYQSAKTVGLFLSMPQNEIKTDEALKDALKNGKDIYVPQVGSNFEKSDMDLLKVVVDAKEDGDAIFHAAWPRNKWGIPEPPEEMPKELAQPGDIDLLIVPGLAFDRNGNRLGQGKGYYDRFIARMSSDGRTLPLIAVCMLPQLVDGSIPVDTYDRTMMMILTPDEVIDISGSGGAK
mmetsp:Transcript_12101/g.33315  ORF Transcript_12101/g.33315 Transcript_12101/m.33315 type:complete len:230 (-) Transcript_12101:914-1603(-)